MAVGVETKQLSTDEDGGLGTLELVIIKQLGFGVAVAVLIDATIVRALLVPALMRLLGDWNWWVPRPIARLLPA